MRHGGAILLTIGLPLVAFGLMGLGVVWDFYTCETWDSRVEIQTRCHTSPGTVVGNTVIPGTTHCTTGPQTVWYCTRRTGE